MLIYALLIAVVAAALYLAKRVRQLLGELPRSNADWIYY